MSLDDVTSFWLSFRSTLEVSEDTFFLSLLVPNALQNFRAVYTSLSVSCMRQDSPVLRRVLFSLIYVGYTDGNEMCLYSGSGIVFGLERNFYLSIETQSKKTMDQSRTLCLSNMRLTT